MKKQIFLILIFFILVISAGFADPVSDLLLEAQYFRENGFTNNAIATYQEILKEDPNNLEAIRQFGDFMVEAKNYSYALVMYKKYLTLCPDDLNVRELVIDLYVSLNVYTPAINECLTYLKIDKGNLSILKKLCSIYKITGFIKEETIINNELLKIDKDNVDTLSRLFYLYINTGKYKDAVTILDEKKGFIDNYPKDLIAYVYLKAEKYNKAIKMYEEIYNKEPNKTNSQLLYKAKLENLSYLLDTSFRDYKAFYTPMKQIAKDFEKGREIFNYAEKEVAGTYFGYEKTTGKSGVNYYDSNYFRLQFPILSQGLDLYLINKAYTIWDENLKLPYNQTGIEFRQSLDNKLSLSGGYFGGMPRNTYNFQLFYQAENFEAAVAVKKNYIIQTPEALYNEIMFDSSGMYLNWNAFKRVNIYTYLSKFNFTDSNNASFAEYGATYRLWENSVNSWANIGIDNVYERYDFETPLYYSPNDLKQTNYSIEWNCYLQPQTFLSLTYTISNDQNNSNYNVYSAFLDHKLSENSYLYVRYLNGLSTLGRIGTFDQPGSQDNELSVGIKFKF